MMHLKSLKFCGLILLLVSGESLGIEQLALWDRPLKDVNRFPLPEFHLVEITKENPKILVDMKYTTDDNSFGKAISAETKCLVSRRVMDKLNRVQAELERQGLGLKVFDAFRPLYVEVALIRSGKDYQSLYGFDSFCKELGLIPQSEKDTDWIHSKLIYPRPPRPLPILPPSTRGAAVAVTLVTKDGKELEMPTKFDDRSEKARPAYQDLSEEVVKNRRLLKDIMFKHGFKQADTWYEFYDEKFDNSRSRIQKADEYPRYLYSKYTTAVMLTQEQENDQKTLTTEIILRLRGC